MIDSRLTLSVVVTSYTLERLNDIMELLDSLNNQTRDPEEIILVVEKSTELYERIKRYASEKAILNTRVVFNDGEPGLSAGRNLGIKEATGDIIAFIDDDALPSPDWAEEMVKTYQDESVIGATGPISPLWKDEPVDWFPEELDWILSCTGFSSIAESREVRNAFGTNMSFRKEAFVSGGLFLTQLGAKGGGASGKHELVGDETEFSVRARRKTGKRLLFNPSVKAEHKVYKYRITPTFIARRAYWEGYTKALFSKSFRDSNNNENPLSVEYKLLQRILTRLFPSILLGAFKHPVIAWRRFCVMLIVLSSVAFGYLVYSFQSLFGYRKVFTSEEQTKI